MFERRKGVILMNNKTRYCIMLYGLNKWAGDLMCGTLGYAHPIDLLKKEMSEIDV